MMMWTLVAQAVLARRGKRRRGYRSARGRMRHFWNGSESVKPTLPQWPQRTRRLARASLVGLINLVALSDEQTCRTPNLNNRSPRFYPPSLNSRLLI